MHLIKFVIFITLCAFVYRHMIIFSSHNRRYFFIKFWVLFIFYFLLFIVCTCVSVSLLQNNDTMIPKKLAPQVDTKPDFLGHWLAGCLYGKYVPKWLSISDIKLGRGIGCLDVKTPAEENLFLSTQQFDSVTKALCRNAFINGINVMSSRKMEMAH